MYIAVHKKVIFANIAATLSLFASYFLFNLDLYDLFFIYWLELVIVIIFNISKLETTKKINNELKKEGSTGNGNLVGFQAYIMLYIAMFFFMGFFRNVIMIQSKSVGPDLFHMIAVLPFAYSHYLSYIENYKTGKEYERVSSSKQIWLAAIRLFGLFFSISIPLWYFTSIDERALYSIYSFILYVIVKGLIDLAVHIKIHSF